MNDIIYVGKHTVTYSVTWHTHEHWELIYCTYGSGTLIFQDRQLAYGKDTVALIPPFIPHANEGNQDGFTNIHLNMRDTSLAFKEPVVMSPSPSRFLQDLFTAAFYYYSHNEIDRSLLLPAYGQLIVNTLSLIQTEQLHSEPVRKIEYKILRNYPDPYFDLNSYLESMPFSTAYLKKLFRKEVGQTPLQFLTEKRLENAAGNLAASAPGTSITEIARLCGFQEPLYFSRLFKKKYGVSPRNYLPHAITNEVVNGDEMKIQLENLPG